MTRPDAPEPALDLNPHPSRRIRLLHALCRAFVGAYLRPRYEGRDRLPAGGAILTFNHLSWTDPFVVFASLPAEPRLYLFGPKEADMSVGLRNRLIAATRVALPFRPDRRDLVGIVRRVEAVMAAGGRLAIAAEGRIHVGERRVEPLSGGIALFARRSGAPVVPMAINGTSYIAFRRPVRVRFGAPLTIAPGETDADFVARVRAALLGLVADWPETGAPRWPLGRVLSDLFNDWSDSPVRPASPDDDGLPVVIPSITPVLPALQPATTVAPARKGSPDGP